jgi:hypothetical protein
MKTFTTVHQVTDEGSRGETLDDLKEMFGKESSIVKIANKLKLNEATTVEDSDTWIYRTN